MTKLLNTAGAALAIAITLAAPAQAQLLRGGVGGGLGGGAVLGGGLPVGSIGGAEDIGTSGVVTGTVDGTTRSVRSNAHVSQSIHTTVKVPEVPVPAVDAPALAVPNVRSVTGAARVGPAVRYIHGAVVVPAIPNLAVRRAAIREAGIVAIGYAEVPAYVDQEYVVLENELRGTGVQLERQGQQIVLEMPSDVTFSFNKYNIQPRFYGVLNAVSHTLAKYPATYVDVNGHADAVGSLGYNQVLSERRANSVGGYLASREVNPARLHEQGFGKTEPIASNATIPGRAANRRVEIILTPYAG